MYVHCNRTLMFLIFTAGMMPLRATTPGAVPGEGLYGQYFNNTDLTGGPTMRRTDRQIDFAWAMVPWAKAFAPATTPSVGRAAWRRRSPAPTRFRR